jgi:hypothetical protein
MAIQNWRRCPKLLNEWAQCTLYKYQIWAMMEIWVCIYTQIISLREKNECTDKFSINIISRFKVLLSSSCQQYYTAKEIVYHVCIAAHMKVY